jgi:hypothetical protein
MDSREFLSACKPEIDLSGYEAAAWPARVFAKDVKNGRG